MRSNMVSYRRIRGRLVKALPSPIVGLVRLCLGSTMTSSDLPPDLHSNHIESIWCRCVGLAPVARLSIHVGPIHHIEILYSIDLLRIGPVPAYTLFVYLPSVGRCKVLQYSVLFSLSPVLSPPLRRLNVLDCISAYLLCDHQTISC